MTPKGWSSASTAGIGLLIMVTQRKTRLLRDGQIVQKMRHQNRYLSGQPENMLGP